MKKSFSLSIDFILLIIFLMLIILTLLLINLIYINNITYPLICDSSHYCNSSAFHYDYDRKSSIFNPIIDLFYKNSYFPSHFVDTNVRYTYIKSNYCLLDVISNKQYYILDKTYNGINELSNDLTKIIREYKNDQLFINNK